MIATIARIYGAIALVVTIYFLSGTLIVGYPEFGRPARATVTYALVIVSSILLGLFWIVLPFCGCIYEWCEKRHG